MFRIAHIFKRFLFLCATIWFVWCIASYAVYRITAGEGEEIISGEVHYKVVELDLSNRALFESLFGDRIVRLEGQPVLFVPASQTARLWAQPWYEMQQKN